MGGRLVDAVPGRPLGDAVVELELLPQPAGQRNETLDPGDDGVDRLLGVDPGHLARDRGPVAEVDLQGVVGEHDLFERHVLLREHDVVVALFLELLNGTPTAEHENARGQGSITYWMSGSTRSRSEWKREWYVDSSSAGSSPYTTMRPQLPPSGSSTLRTLSPGSTSSQTPGESRPRTS